MNKFEYHCQDLFKSLDAISNEDRSLLEKQSIDVGVCLNDNYYSTHKVLTDSDLHLYGTVEGLTEQCNKSNIMTYNDFEYVLIRYLTRHPIKNEFYIGARLIVDPFVEVISEKPIFNSHINQPPKAYSGSHAERLVFESTPIDSSRCKIISNVR